MACNRCAGAGVQEGNALKSAGAKKVPKRTRECCARFEETQVASGTHLVLHSQENSGIVPAVHEEAFCPRLGGHNEDAKERSRVLKLHGIVVAVCGMQERAQAMTQDQPWIALALKALPR